MEFYKKNTYSYFNDFISFNNLYNCCPRVMIKQFVGMLLSWTICHSYSGIDN